MTRERFRKFIFWDLDGTIGYFRRLAYLNPDVIPEWEKPLSLRYGIKELLQEFSAAGFTHYITTTGTLEYATRALQHTGLSNSFSDIFGNDIVGGGWTGKHYRPVTNKVDLSDEDVRANVIVIGDSSTDKPDDIDGLVFLELGTENSLEALVIREILTTLMDAGDGNLKKGFETIYKRASVQEKQSHPQTRIHKLGNGIQFQLCYRDLASSHDSGRKEVPVIRNIVAKEYEKEWTVIS